MHDTARPLRNCGPGWRKGDEMVEINDEELERRLKAIRLETSPDLDARVMELGMQPVPRSRRRVVTVVARLAVAAAAVCMVVVLAWWLLSRSEVMPSAYAQLMEVVENSQKAEWVHMRGKIEGQEYEAWYSQRPLQIFSKTAGQIVSIDPKTQSSYDSATGILTVQRTKLEVATQLETGGSLFDAMVKQIESAREQAGVEVTEEEQVLAGEPVKVFTIRYQTSEERYTVDPLAKRMVRFENLKRNGTLFAAYDIDYPDTGPADIYALGVPRGARIVDLSPPVAFNELNDKVEAARAGFAHTYYAVVYEVSVRDGFHTPFAVAVVYKKDGRYRVERYSVVKTPDAAESEQLWQKFKDGDVTSLESRLRSWQADEIEIEFYDAARVTTVRTDNEGNLRKHTEQAPPYSQLRLPVESNIWGQSASWVTNLLPYVGKTTRMLPPMETDDGALMGVEHVWQGYGTAIGIDSRPGKMTQHFSPKHDYVCEISEFEEDTQADWQEDKEWLKDVPAGAPHRDRYVHESRKVLEYAQTTQGRWYARIIRKETCYDRAGTGRFEVITLIHVDTERDIPDELFDPNSVTAEMFQAEEAQQPGSE